MAPPKAGEPSAASAAEETEKVRFSAANVAGEETTISMREETSMDPTRSAEEVAVGLHISVCRGAASAEASVRRRVLALDHLDHREEVHFVLYLSSETWLGEKGERLAEEVREARAAKTPIVMVHSTPANEDGCEFGRMFAVTPQDLIQDKLYKDLALAVYPPPFHHVSSCLIARALGATDPHAPRAKLRRGLSKRFGKLSGKKLPVSIPAPTSTTIDVESRARA